LRRQCAAAKTGDIVAAGTVVAVFINPDAVERLRTLVDRQPAVLLPVHALEVGGVNEIPIVLARELGRRLGLPVSTSVVQSNAVGHTCADGFHRLANQALFEGVVARGARYLIVDDFVGQGGTLAEWLDPITLSSFVSGQCGALDPRTIGQSWSFDPATMNVSLGDAK
jgi:hypothetical protein